LGVRSAALGCLLVVQLGQPPQPASAAERGAAEEIVDQFRRGEEAWRASCPQPTEDGSCVELRSTRFRPRLFVIERDPALVAEARRHFLAVATLWRRLGGHEIPGATETLHPRRAPSVHIDYREIFRADADVAAALRHRPVPAAAEIEAVPFEDRGRAKVRCHNLSERHGVRASHRHIASCTHLTGPPRDRL